ncbi:ankyrin-1-like, partial [Achlya hypogyna]
SQTTALHHAAWRGHVAIVHKLIAAGADVNAVNAWGKTPLHDASERGHGGIVRLIQEAGANPRLLSFVDSHVSFWHLTCVECESARELAEKNNHAEVLRLLDDAQQSELVKAAIAGDEMRVVDLLARGADINAADDSGATPLWSAVKYGHSRIVTHLLKAGASEFQVTTALLDIASMDNSSGSSLLTIAKRAGNETIVAELQKAMKTALFAAVAVGSVALVVSALSEGMSTDCFNESGQSLLHLAADGGHMGVVAVLLAAGASVDLPDMAGVLPLVVAESRGHAYVVRLLREALRHKCSEMGRMLLQAVRNGDEQRTIDLLTKGATVVSEPAGETLLHVAAKCNHVAVLTALLKANVIDVDTRNEAGATALFLAAASGEVDAVNTLLQADADVNLSDRDGATPLLVPVQKGHASVIGQLLRAGAGAALPTEASLSTPVLV